MDSCFQPLLKPNELAWVEQTEINNVDTKSISMMFVNRNGHIERLA